MPLYDFQCTRCDHMDSDVLQKIATPNPPCTVCGFPTAKVFHHGAAVHIFPEGFFPHIAEDPIFIKSKRQLREECRSRGLTSHYAE